MTTKLSFGHCVFEPVAHVNILKVLMVPLAKPWKWRQDCFCLSVEVDGPPTKTAVAHNVMLKLAHDVECSDVVRLVNHCRSGKVVLLLAPLNVIGKDDNLNLFFYQFFQMS
jgi:hypothetical protein